MGAWRGHANIALDWTHSTQVRDRFMIATFTGEWEEVALQLRKAVPDTEWWPGLACVEEAPSLCCSGSKVRLRPLAPAALQHACAVEHQLGEIEPRSAATQAATLMF